MRLTDQFEFATPNVSDGFNFFSTVFNGLFQQKKVMKLLKLFHLNCKHIIVGTQNHS
jgi:hypothetical protein